MRIGIVNRQPEVAEVLRRALALVPEREVAWTAARGEAAVELCRRDRPDLVLLDLFLPDIDGVETSRRIMATAPCAILLLTAGIEAHAGRVFQAMGEGALDAIDLPVLEGVGDPASVRAACAPLIAKIEAIAGLLGRRRALRPRILQTSQQDQRPCKALNREPQFNVPTAR